MRVLGGGLDNLYAFITAVMKIGEGDVSRMVLVLSVQIYFCIQITYLIHDMDESNRCLIDNCQLTIVTIKHIPCLNMF